VVCMAVFPVSSEPSNDSRATESAAELFTSMGRLLVRILMTFRDIPGDIEPGRIGTQRPGLFLPQHCSRTCEQVMGPGIAVIKVTGWNLKNLVAPRPKFLSNGTVLGCGLAVNVITQPIQVDTDAWFRRSVPLKINVRRGRTERSAYAYLPMPFPCRGSSPLHHIT